MKRETISKTIQKVSLVELSKEQIPEAAQVRDMLDAVYKEASKYGIEKETVNEIMESESVKSYVGDVASTFSEYILTGKTGKVMTKQEFNRSFEENIDAILASTSSKISQKDKEDFMTYVEVNSDEIIERIPTVEELTMQLPVRSLESLRIFFAPTLKWIFIVGILLSSILLIALSWKKQKWLKSIGVPLLLSSFFLLAFGLVLPVLFKVMADLLEGYIVLVMNHFLTPYSYQYVKFGLVGILIALIFLGIYTRNRKKQKVVEKSS